MSEENLPNERAVIEAIQDGDRAAFGQLVRHYQRRAYGAAYGIVRNRDDALELAQDAFVRAYRAMDRFDPEMPFYPWLYRIIRNTAFNFLKKKRRRGESSLDLMMETGYDAVDPGRGPEEYADLGELKTKLEAALSRLTPDQQEILQLRHFAELSYAEIAACLEIPQGTVMSRLYGARKALRKALDGQEQELAHVG